MRQEINLGKIPLLISDWDDFFNHKSTIVETCILSEKINTIESNVAVKAKHNLWESPFNFLENTKLVDLKLWIILESEFLISSLNNRLIRVSLIESWAHVTRTGGFHSPHYHNNSTWSGIFYVQSDDIDSGKNNWYLPYYIERKIGLEFAEDKISASFVPGRMLLFPSMLLHDAAPYLGSDPRIVIGFNLICL